MYSVKILTPANVDNDYACGCDYIHTVLYIHIYMLTTTLYTGMPLDKEKVRLCIGEQVTKLNHAC